MANLNSGAFTGDKSAGNPYSGDLGKGIAYDTYEANVPLVVQEGDYPKIFTNYRTGAKRLVQYSSVQENAKMLDLGSGTGISALEIFTQKPGASVTGIELSEGMLLVARYKFGQDDGNLLEQVNDEKLLQYWRQFRTEAAAYKNRVKFVQGDFQQIDCLKSESFDGAVAAQFMHWTDFSKSFAQLRKFLKNKGEVVWNSASHFFNDQEFPIAEYGFRYNGFLAHVLEDVCSRGGWEANDYHTIGKPSQDINTITEVTSGQGFQTTQVATYLNPVDLQVFAQNHVPVLVKQLITSPADPGELETRIKEAIGRAITNPQALSDTKHKYEIMPVFKSIKLK